MDFNFIQYSPQNLETIPRLKDTISEREAEIADLKKHIEEKNALLSAARKTVREYKETIRVGRLQMLLFYY